MGLRLCRGLLLRLSRRTTKKKMGPSVCVLRILRAMPERRKAALFFRDLKLRPCWPSRDSLDTAAFGPDKANSPKMPLCAAGPRRFEISPSSAMLSARFGENLAVLACSYFGLSSQVGDQPASTIIASVDSGTARSNAGPLRPVKIKVIAFAYPLPPPQNQLFLGSSSPLVGM